MAVAELFILVIFTIILAKSASLVVEKAVVLSKFFGISQLAMGMLLIAVSTSLPELSVSVISSAANEGAIAAGNVFGSNIANILLILGIGAFAYGFKVGRKNLVDIGLVLLLTTAISAYIIFRGEVLGSALGVYEGALLLVIAGWYAFRMLKSRQHSHDGAENSVSRKEGLYAFLLFFAGIIVVIISSSIVVDSAVRLADMLGLAKSFVGATIIAVGTSLPELSVELQAFRKKRYEIALGDAIGSNMANLTLVLGTAAVIQPIFVQLNVFVAALLFAVVANIAFFFIAATKKRFGRAEGVAMLALYAVYLASIFFLQFAEKA